MISIFDEIENIVGKGKKIMVTSIFLLSSQCFQKAFFPGSKNQGLYGKGLRLIFFMKYKIVVKLKIYSFLCEIDIEFIGWIFDFREFGSVKGTWRFCIQKEWQEEARGTNCYR